MMANILVSNFYNEEFLLPFWLDHHVNMFDHGILVNYWTNDNSIDIIREMAPSWEIRDTRNEHFIDPYISQELQDIEREYPGDWKMTLNTTEFLFTNDLKSYTQKLESEGKRAIRTNGIVMVDKEQRQFGTTARDLFYNKHHGYFEETMGPENWNGNECYYKVRSRTIHRERWGNYVPGRHGTRWTDEVDEEFLLCWFNWCPWNEQMKKRALQYCDNIPDEVLHSWYNEEWIKQYSVTEEVLDRRYEREKDMCYNLLTDRRYRKVYERYTSS